ncbi:hypothetical protein ACWGCW_22100 [Streptomyces sp. NPDC054933]
MTSQEQHLDVGAYVLGALDDTEATRFEEHMADGPVCTAEFDSLLAVEPLLAEYAASAPDLDSLTAEPSEGLLSRLVEQVGTAKRATRRRRLSLAAAAAALIVAGPAVTAAVTSGSSSSPTQEPFMHHQAMADATDPGTRVNAEVALEDKPWGTHVGLKLGGVRGPLQCDLVAVSAKGQRQTVTTWSVPGWGYGVPSHPDPLTIHGGTGIPRRDIARFEVWTLDGHKLVTVKL